jgi:hypothetical protein
MGPSERSQLPMPVIVGSPRSGTTLLRLMLDAHPLLAIPPETGFLVLGSKFQGTDESLRENFFRALTNYPEAMPVWPDFEIPEEAFRVALSEIHPFTIPEGFRAFYRLYAARFGKPRWGDKTPLYCLDLNTIRQLLPEARFVHIIRDGRDAALSLRSMWFSPGWEMETQAAYWRNCVLAARRAGLNHPDYLEVRYEDLILRTENTLGRICTHAGLSFDQGMLNYHARGPERLREHKGRWRPDGSLFLSQQQRLSQQKRAAEPLNPERVFAWKREMSAEERAKFQSVAGDLLKELGYEV